MQYLGHLSKIGGMAQTKTRIDSRRQLRQAVRRILAAVKKTAALGDEARRAHDEFERLAERESEVRRG